MGWEFEATGKAEDALIRMAAAGFTIWGLCRLARALKNKKS